MIVYGLIFAYFAITLGIGILSKKRNSNGADYLLASRSLTLPAFIFTLVATWYGGILGVGEFTFKYGISNWVVFGVPYYIFAILFALFLAKIIRQNKQTTIPDQFYKHFGKTAGMISAILIFALVVPGAYAVALGKMIQWLTGISYLPSVIFGVVFSTIYLFRSGFRSVVRTDFFQFVLMFLGFAILFIASFVKFGGLPTLAENLPKSHLSWSGGNSILFIIVWFFIALWTFVDPGFHQRVAAAKDEKIAKKGILISIGFWLIFDFLTTMCGLYAKAFLPIHSTFDVMFVFPELAHNVLPSVFLGLFLVGIFATIMSTLDSFSFIGATTIGRDILGKLKFKLSEKSAIKIGLIFTGIFSIVLAHLIPSVIDIWYTIGTLIIPALLLPLLSTYFTKIQLSTKWTIFTMIISFFTSAVWYTIGQLNSQNGWADYPLGIEPMIPGLIVSAFPFLLKIRK